MDHGLGNFVFHAKKAVTVETGVLELTLPGTGGVPQARWRPATIEAGVPVPLEGSAADEAVRHEESLRSCTDLAATP